MRSSRICLVTVIGVTLVAGCGGDQSSRRFRRRLQPRPARRLDPQQRPMHAKHLFVGVSCSTGNEIGCDGIALSVEVPDEPDYVEANVDGYRARLERVATGKNADAYYQGRHPETGPPARGSACGRP